MAEEREKNAQLEQRLVITQQKDSTNVADFNTIADNSAVREKEEDLVIGADSGSELSVAENTQPVSQKAKLVP